MQIGENLYIGPSSGKETLSFDDYVNHSCNPNSGLQIIGHEAILIAIKPIAKDEEIFWDYSTMMAEDEWEIDCECGNANCRGRVRDFKHLSVDVQCKYAALGIVLAYVLESSSFFGK